MTIFSAQVYPGHALGFLVLGATLHDILTRLRADLLRFSKIDLIFEQNSPLAEPVILGLPNNGLRLRFDGPEQRLRLIEVLDFTKSHLTYKDKEILRPSTYNQIGSGAAQCECQPGPLFKHIYNRLLGPTFPGEYIEPDQEEHEMGTYVLSYPGIAFSFPLAKSKWSPEKDCVSLLSSSTTQFASSMAIYRGKSWSHARESLFTYSTDKRDLHSIPSKNRELARDEVTLIKIHGQGQIELLRPEGLPSFWMKLGLTSPQDLVANLGPPDAIYRKTDQSMSIHKSSFTGYGRRLKNTVKSHEDSSDTDQSSIYSFTDSSDNEERCRHVAGSASGECFYNYFYLGFDVFLSTSIGPSPCPPSKKVIEPKSDREYIIQSDLSNRLLATKLIIHGNIPGSYSFNRHRRCRWEISYLEPRKDQKVINSESPFDEIKKRLQDEWKNVFRITEKQDHQLDMVLNRDWGDSPESSCELLGDWEENASYKKTDLTDDDTGLDNTTLCGFPGLVFEVMKNGFVSGVTVF
ncbi:UPF0183 protein [Golovinomyces cichoracearum]|uniref:UPF0183 protein n=1 Tax=Golovinomyces cichoracearum TaxID=62708 RepID=A0A420I8Q6_9PEZI|nr:UPF0183 protein [Golovinomyces cichoracearum]